MHNYRAAKLFLLINSIMLLILFVLAAVSPSTTSTYERARLAAALATPDLVITCEAKHTRHFLMPEYVSAFQDFPGYHDHFVSSMFCWPHLEQANTHTNRLAILQDSE